MRLLIITDAWPPQVHGAARGAHARVERLRRLGHDVEVIEPSQFACVYAPFYREVPLALLPYRRIRARLARRDFDAVHLEVEGPLGWAARRACLRLNIPFTTWYHTRFDVYLGLAAGVLMPIVGAFLRRFHGAAAHVFVSTQSLKAMLEAQGYRNAVIVPLGVDTELFVRNPAPQAPELPGPVFCYFSRLAPEKSPEEFFALDLPGTKLVIGSGPLHAKLEAAYRGANVRFVGYRHGQELVDWLSRADVMIFPSRTDTFGLVVIESLACGLPVVAHDAMGPRDIITDGVDGYLTDDLQTGALKALTLDRAQCRAKAEQYSWGHSAQMFVESLARVR